MEERSTSDLELVNAIRRGDIEIFRRLVERHEGRLRAILLRLVSDPMVAEELAQESFVKAYRALDSFRGDSSFGTWLVQIALHLARDRARARSRRQVVSLDELREQSGEDRWAETRAAYDPTVEVESRELREHIEGELKNLPDAYREVFVLHHVEDFDYDQIAEWTGDSVGALKVRAHRARKMLLEALERREYRPGTRRA